MSETKRLVPKRRFKEFQNAGDWEECVLGEIGNTYTGLSGKTKEDFGHGKGSFITYMNVYSNSIADSNNIGFVEIDESQNKVKFGDVFFTTSSETPEEVGMTSVWLKSIDNVYLNSFCFGYRLAIEINPYYLAYMFRSPGVRNKIKLLAQGISRYNISKRKVMDIKIPIPQINEQKKIGDFFADLDNLITLHQQKLDKIKSMKKAYLYEMFPAEGETKPKRRFKGFTDDWEECKLGDLTGQTYGGGTPSTTVENFWNGEIPWIQSSDIIEGNVFYVAPRKKITQKGIQHSATKLVPKNSIAIVTRVGVGKLAFMPYTYATSQDFLSLSDLKIDSNFGVYSCYKKLQSELYSVQGTSIKGITKDELLSKIISVSSLEEQAKIGSLFTHLDNLITLNQRKLDKLQNLKKAYLNEMFI